MNQQLNKLPLNVPTPKSPPHLLQGGWCLHGCWAVKWKGQGTSNWSSEFVSEEERDREKREMRGYSEKGIERERKNKDGEQERKEKEAEWESEVTKSKLDVLE